MHPHINWMTLHIANWLGGSTIRPIDADDRPGWHNAHGDGRALDFCVHSLDQGAIAEQARHGSAETFALHMTHTLLVPVSVTRATSQCAESSLTRLGEHLESDLCTPTHWPNFWICRKDCYSPQLLGCRCEYHSVCGTHTVLSVPGHRII